MVGVPVGDDPQPQNVCPLLPISQNSIDSTCRKVCQSHTCQKDGAVIDADFTTCTSQGGSWTKDNSCSKETEVGDICAAFPDASCKDFLGSYICVRPLDLANA